MNCGNRYLVDAYWLVADQLAALRAHLRTIAQDSARDEHTRIIAAFASDDLPRAQAILSQHTLKMKGRYLLALRTGTLGGGPSNEYQMLAPIAQDQ